MDKNVNFVDYVVRICQEDKGKAARLRRADNPSTEYQAWELLAPFIDLTQNDKRLPYALIAASIAKMKEPHNGTFSLGQGLKNCYGTETQEQAERKLRRLLSCNNIQELCLVLRPFLSLIQSKLETGSLNYADLLGNLLFFSYDSEKIKLRWAKDFYAQKQEDE